MSTRKKVKRKARRKGQKLLRRLFFLGGLIVAGRYVYEKLNQTPNAAPTSTYSVESTPAAEAPKARPTAAKKPAAKGDDLTQIKGIGPTYAKRLQAAGITTFMAVAETPAAKLAEIAQLRDWQAADSESWVEQAKEQS